MATVTGLTAARMLAIEAACIVNGAVVLDNLILTRHDGTTINAGSVRGPQGIQGPAYVPPAWQAWNPVYDGGTMTVADATGSHPSGNMCRYMILGKTCYIEHARVLAKGGTASAAINLTLPTPAKYGRAAFAALTDNGPGMGGIFDNLNQCTIAKPPAWDTGSSLFALGNHWVQIQGFYEIP